VFVCVCVCVCECVCERVCRLSFGGKHSGGGLGDVMEEMTGCTTASGDRNRCVCVCHCAFVKVVCLFAASRVVEAWEV